MKAVLLAAGRSSRLRPLTDHVPKCLLTVDGTAILRRAVEALVACGVGELVVVTGYLGPTVRGALATWFPGLPVTYRDNPAFASTQNGASLLCARAAVEGQPFLLLDGDIVFDRDVLAAVIDAPFDDCLALRPAADLGEEEVKVVLYADGARVRRIHVSLPPGEAAGESIGIERFSAATSRVLFAALEARIAGYGAVDEYYEKTFDELCRDGRLALHAVDVGAWFCAEIDTPADLASVDETLRTRRARRAV